MNYYDTTQETEANKAKYSEKNRTQTQEVANIASRLQRAFSPSEIFNQWPNNKTPITSIRRAINKLCNQGIIEKTGKRVKGLYGRNELQYKMVVQA